MTDDNKEPERLASKAKAAVDAILKFREVANERADFVKYKILVGFESVFPGHWGDERYDYSAAEAYRQEKAKELIAEINTSNEEEWLNFLTRCARTKSNDMATFPSFGQFLVNLAKEKPEIADRILGHAREELRRFTAGFLNGLAVSDRKDIYERAIERELASAQNLSGLARHLRFSDVRLPQISQRVLAKALSVNDEFAVIECLLFCMEHFGSEKIDNEEQFFADAMNYLNRLHIWRWVREAWFARGEGDQFFKTLSAERARLLLENLTEVPQIDHQIERILKKIAETRPVDVWDFFGRRIQHERGAEEFKFDAVPYSFHGLEKVLGQHPSLAIDKGLEWYSQDSQLFSYLGGRVVSNAFPIFTDVFATELSGRVQLGGDLEANFALAVLQNYEGERSIHSVLKTIVAKFPEDDNKKAGVRVAIDRTGVMTGEFGAVEAYSARRDILREWLADDRPQVVAFAKVHLDELESWIASETRRAQNESTARKLRYERRQAEELTDEES